MASASILKLRREGKITEILASEKFYRDALTSLIDIIHETVVVKNENLALRIQVREMQLLVAGMEKKVALARKRKSEAA